MHTTHTFKDVIAAPYSQTPPHRVCAIAVYVCLYRYYTDTKYTQKHQHTHTHTHTHTLTRSHKHTYTHTHTHSLTQTYIHTNTRTCTCANMHTDICMPFPP